MAVNMSNWPALWTALLLHSAILVQPGLIKTRTASTSFVESVFKSGLVVEVVTILILAHHLLRDEPPESRRRAVVGTNWLAAATIFGCWLAALFGVASGAR